MKKLLSLTLLSLGLISMAQTIDGSGKLQTNSRQIIKSKTPTDRLQGWFISGNNSLQFNQAAFSNWMAGGVNSYAFNANMDYEFNLTKGKHIWDNRIILAYGMLRNEGEEFRKSNDIIDITSSYGYEIKRHLYLAGALNFKTQFYEGYDYNEDPKKYLSNFLAPGYLQIGFGLDYKPSEELQINFHPLTSRVTFVQDKDLQYAGNYGLKEDGDSYVYEFGAFLGARYKFNIMENISYDNRLGIYSNYLDNPQNMMLAYQGVLDMKVNRFISAQATINLLYDENQIKKTQVKETLGVGLTYKFDNLAKLKEKPENIPTVELEPQVEVTE